MRRPAAAACRCCGGQCVPAGAGPAGAGCKRGSCGGPGRLQCTACRAHSVPSSCCSHLDNIRELVANRGPQPIANRQRALVAQGAHPLGAGQGGTAGQVGRPSGGWGGRRARNAQRRQTPATCRPCPPVPPRSSRRPPSSRAPPQPPPPPSRLPASPAQPPRPPRCRRRQPQRRAACLGACQRSRPWRGCPPGRPPVGWGKAGAGGSTDCKHEAVRNLWESLQCARAPGPGRGARTACQTSECTAWPARLPPPNQSAMAGPRSPARLQHLQQLLAKGGLQAALDAHLHGGAAGGARAARALRQCKHGASCKGGVACAPVPRPCCMHSGAPAGCRTLSKQAASAPGAAWPGPPPPHRSAADLANSDGSAPGSRSAPAAAGRRGRPRLPQHPHCRHRQSGRAERHPAPGPPLPPSSPPAAARVCVVGGR